MIVDTNFEEFPELFKDSCRVGLIQMRQRIKDPFSGINGVSDDDDVLNIWNVNSLIDPTPDSKQLSLSSGNIDSTSL